MKRTILAVGLLAGLAWLILEVAAGHGKPKWPDVPAGPGGRRLADKVGAPGAPTPATTPGAPGPTGATTRGPAGQGPATGGARPVPNHTPRYRRPRAVTGARPVAREKAPERWELWWWYNADAYLGLRAHRLRSHTRTADDRPGLGPARAGRRREQAPGFESQALPSLVTALGSRDVEIVDSAALAIGRSVSRPVPPDIAAALSQALQHPKASAKEAATLAMGLIGDRTFRPLLRALASDSKDSRRAARSPSGIPVVVRGYAALALGMMGDRRDVSFLENLIDKNPRDADDLAGCAVLGLGLGRRTEAIPYLVELIDRVSPSRTIRAFAPIALGKLDRPEAHETIPSLILALRDTRTPTQVERSIVIALGRLARMTDAAPREMLGKIVAGHFDTQCRDFARIALAEIAARDITGWSDHPSLHQTLANRLMRGLSSSTRRAERPWTALALGIALRPFRSRQPELTALATTALSEAMGRSRDISEQTAIAVALGLLEARDQSQAVLDLLDEAYDPVHQGALAIALALLDCRKAAPRLREMIREASTGWFLRRDLARALAILDQRGGLETLLGMLARSRSKYETTSIALALGFLDDSGAIPPLVALLDHPHRIGVVRGVAAEALGLLGEKTLLPWRSQILADHNYRAEIPAVTQMVEWN